MLNRKQRSDYGTRGFEPQPCMTDNHATCLSDEKYEFTVKELESTNVVCKVNEKNISKSQRKDDGKTKPLPASAIRNTATTIVTNLTTP